MNRLAYQVGKRSKVFRQAYHDLSKNKWLWGIYSYIDDYVNHPLPITYFMKNGFSINEGGWPVNLHISWLWNSHYFFIYVCIKRIQLFWIWSRD